MPNVKNNQDTRIDHDGLFKELLQTFFEEFILLFFPQVYEDIDFSHITFLDKEIVLDTQERQKREVDLIVETRLKQQECLFIVHVELQSSYESNFNERMFIYFNRLYEKYRKHILPIAVFSYAEKRKEPSTFQIAFPFLNVLKFQYLTIELRKLNWREYIQKDNPVAAALLSKMGYTKEERVQVKLEFVRMLVRLELDPARTELLFGFFETYLGSAE